MNDTHPVSMIMSTVDLVVATRDETLRTVWERMGEAGIQHIPILDGDQLVGMVTTFDVGRVAIRRGAETLDHMRAEYIMEKALVRLHTKDSVRQATDLLADGDFHSLPVVDDEENLVGIVTTTDLLRHYAGRVRP